MKKSKVTDKGLDAMCQVSIELAKEIHSLTNHLIKGDHEVIRSRKQKAAAYLQASIAFRNLARWLESNA